MKSKQSITRDRVGSILVAFVIHIILVLLLLFAKLSIPRPNVSIVIASPVSPDPEPVIHDGPPFRKISIRNSPAISVLPVIATHAFGSCNVPEFKDSEFDFTFANSIDLPGISGVSVTPEAIFNRSAIPATMRSRCSMSERMKRIRQSGGDERVERVVRKGLQYLETQQNGETGAFGNRYPVAMTGLCLLAYLGHCETPESTKFGDAVVKAALYLMDRAINNDGWLVSVDGTGNSHSTYEHPIAVYALCELYTMTKASGKQIPRLESVLKKSVRKIVEAQDSLGGWSYGFDGSTGVEDMSVSGWMIQSLKAAHNTGIDIKGVDEALDKAVTGYLPGIQDAGGAFKYRPDSGTGKSTLTAAALLGLQMWNRESSETYKRGMAYLTKTYQNPVPGNDYYTPYYNTQVFFLHGGNEWESYNKKFQPVLIAAQNADGSWTRSLEGRAKEDSVIMNTAWAILMLEVYYRYLPTTDKLSR